ncbi:MAG: DUF2344 domain-containing protein [Sedimentisphaerales bacterium]|nr:DUF2344 domain-containing protein [Sedimentisphaerales bacterium]
MKIETLNDHSPCPSGAAEAWPATNATAAVWFRLDGRLRFLSHAETMRLWQRVCVRAGICVQYTEGFNPHPKMSLPLPRAVGVASDDELLVLRLRDERGLPNGPEGPVSCAAWEVQMKETLGRVVPEGIEVVSVRLMASKVSFRCGSAVYALPLHGSGPERADERNKKVERVLTSECLTVERKSPKSRGARLIDVRPFLKSIELKDDCLTVECEVTASGSVRVDEMMRILGVEADDLAGPIRRTRVQWSLT